MDDEFGEPQEIYAIIILLMRDISRMGYLAKQSFEVLEINENEAKAINFIQEEEDLNDSLREQLVWNRLTNIYEKKQTSENRSEMFSKILDEEYEIELMKNGKN